MISVTFQHVCMDLAEEFVSLDLNQKPAESLQSQQEMKYKINGAFEVLSTQLQPMVSHFLPSA